MSLFRILNLVIFQSCILSNLLDSGYLMCEAHPKFNADLFQTLHAFSSWSEDMHMLWI